MQKQLENLITTFKTNKMDAKQLYKKINLKNNKCVNEEKYNNNN